jgi:hypothetical protein
VLGLEKLFTGASIFAAHGPLMILGMMLCLFGVQLLAVGLVGELVMRTHFESRTKPLYRVERVFPSAVSVMPSAYRQEKPLATGGSSR